MPYILADVLDSARRRLSHCFLQQTLSSVINRTVCYDLIDVLTVRLCTRTGVRTSYVPRLLFNKMLICKDSFC